MKSNKYIKNNQEDLPNNFYAERMVLASIFIDEQAIYLINQKLSVEAFYFKAHQNIYLGCLDLAKQGKLVDPTTLISWLNDNHLLKETNGIEVVSELMEEFVILSTLETYICLVQEKYLRRLLIKLGYEIVNTSYATEISLEKIFDQVEEKIYNLTTKKKDDSITAMAELLSSTVGELKNRTQTPSLLGLSSSFIELDSLLHGFQNSDLIIIAGRPSMGKTSFSLNIASNVAKNHNLPVLIFSLEMSKQQLIYRFLAKEAGIESNTLRSARLSENDWKKINKAVLVLSKQNLFFDDAPSLTISTLRFKIKKFLLQEKKLGLIIIDYLQLIQDSGKTQNRAQELGQITRSLKTIAKEFNLPIIVLSQLSRNVEARTNKRPILSDLRESGCVDISYFLNESHRLKNNFYGWNGQFFKHVKYKNLRVTGIKPIYTVKTLGGFNLRLTADHKFYTKDKWLPLKELKINTSIGLKIKEVNCRKYVATNVLWDKVLKIEYMGLKKVIDIVIPETSNYLLDHVLIHNSIEQDADVVIMIYRENLYNTNQQDNEVEFIVAKHRNGPTGNFKLSYDPKLTRFFNI